MPVSDTANSTKRAHDRPSRSQDDIRRERDQLRSVSAKAIEIAGAPAVFDPHVAAEGPAQLGQPLRERRDAFQSSLIALDRAHQHADPAHALALLRPRRERPRGSAAEERDELAPFHCSIAPVLPE